MSEAVVVTLEAPGQRDVCLLVRDLQGDPLPVAASFLEQLERLGYATDAVFPLIVCDGTRVNFGRGR